MDSAVLSLKWPAFIRTSELQHYFKGAFITACELALGRCRPLPDARRDHSLKLMPLLCLMVKKFSEPKALSPLEDSSRIIFKKYFSKHRCKLGGMPFIKGEKSYVFFVFIFGLRNICIVFQSRGIDCCPCAEEKHCVGTLEVLAVYVYNTRLIYRLQLQEELDGCKIRNHPVPAGLVCDVFISKLEFLFLHKGRVLFGGGLRARKLLGFLCVS